MAKIKFVLTSIFTVIIFLCCFGCTSQGATETEKTVAENKTQADLTNAIKLSQQDLIIFSEPNKYTYEDFLSDTKKICDLYPSQVHYKKLCDTADGREVVDIILGDINGNNHILIFGAMHAREYITMQVVMRQLCDAIDAINGYGGNYKGQPLNELLQGVTIHFVPDSNPDGVAISQFGLSGIKTEQIRNQVSRMNRGDLVQWKANANGVDLNRNFDAGWQEFRGSQSPSPERCKGSYPGSENESAALINLTKDFNMKRTISYHTCGALIYWYYKQTGTVLAESKKFANEISSATGYYLDNDYTAVDAAGYKDWAVYKLGIPSLTIEVGGEDGYIDNPVAQYKFKEIWKRNKNVVYATVYDLKFK